MPSGLSTHTCACGAPTNLSGICSSCQKENLKGQLPLLQTKLTINQPGDRYEQEADRVADTIMRMPDPAIQRAPT
jgi:hypothetical protein